MKPPVRLLDDAELEPELRDALRIESERAVPFDVSVGLERLSDAIAAGAAPSATVAASSGAWKLKLLLGGGAGGAVAAALVAVGISRSEPPPEPAPAAPAAAAIESARPPPLPAPAASEPAVPISPSASAPAQPAVPAPRASASDARARLAEEVQHLAEVRRLAASNPAAAAKLADEGHRRFRAGMLYQEREAVAISALARAGQSAAARARGERFLERFPKSPFAEQIRTIVH
jgi:hypothetical protein